MLHPMQRYNLENISADNNDTSATKILQSSLYLKQAGSAPKLFSRKPALKKNQFNESSSSQLTNNNNLGQNSSLLSNLSQNAYDLPRNKGAHSFSTSNKFPASSLNPYLPLQASASTKSNANLHLSTSTGQMPAITQSQSTTYFQGQQSSQKNQLNNSRGSISFASKGGNSSTIAGGASTAKRSFYHHSNIFNLKQYKNLTGYIMDGADIDEVKNQQRSLLIREFRQRVGQYLLLSKYRKDQATREFNGYYTRIQGQLFNSSSNSNFSLHNNNNNDTMVAGAANRTKISNGRNNNNNNNGNGGMSFFSSVGMQNQQQLQSDDPNQSLSLIQQNQGELNRSMLNIDANRFNYSKLSKQEASLINNMSIDIYLEDTAGHKSSLNAAHRFDHSKLQEMILDKLAPLIPNDIEYDQKIEKYTREYDRILQKIQNKSFTIKVPAYYEPQMQPFNEFYSIDYSKKKNSKEEEIPWNEINEQVINQVLEQDDMEVEQQDEEEEPEEEEESEEQMEIEEEVEQKEEEDVPIIKSRRSQKVTGQSELAVLGTEIKTIQKVVKVAKKKKKNQVIKIDLQNEETKQDGEEQDDDNGDQHQQRRDNHDSQVNTPKGTVQKRERKPAAGKERSAMEEYLVFRPTSPAAPKKPRKKEEPTVITKQAAPVKKTATPAAKTQIPNISIPNSSRKDSSPKAESRSKTNREESPKKESQTNVNVEAEEEIKVVTVPVQEKTVVKEVIQVKDPVSTPKAKEQKKEVSIGQPVNEVVVVQEQTKINTTTIPVAAPVPSVQQPAPSVVQPKTQTPTQLAPPQSQNIAAAPVQPRSSFKQDKVPIYSPRPKQTETNKDNDDEDDDDEEDDDEAEVPNAQTGRKQSTAGTPKQKGVTPRNKTNSSANEDNRQMQSDNTYYNQIIVKKRIGTGLIDELVKINYLLDFNVNSFKKDRKAPELPRELEFKGDEDRLLFDSIFQWQYEVDQDIEEMEEKLNVATTHRKHYDSDDDDDEHYQGKSKGSVHSSEITDFGPAPPLRTDMQDLDDDDQFSDQDD